MTYEQIEVTTAGAAATVTMSRPDALNAITPTMLGELNADLDAAVDELIAAIAGNSAGSLVAYKDLYRVAESAGVADGLAHEAATSYDIADTDERLASFR